jgi:SMI1-KNR4 cell-wall
MRDMWIEWLSSRPYAAELEFRRPADEHVLSNAERQLGAPLAADLHALLGESDGVLGQYGLGVVWPAARIVEDNVNFRTGTGFTALYMPFDGMLFFADAGNGDQFAFRVLARESGPDIYAWNHEDDSRMWVARDLPDYFDRWLGGELKI